MIAVACAILFHENKILVTQRSPGMHQPFKWEFPGGKIEAGETGEACIIRELYEELHITVNVAGKLKDFSHDYGSFQIVLIPFIVFYKSGTITLTEHMNYKWLSPFELEVLDWAPADIALMKEVIKKFNT